jgi:hypothetical protein
VCRTVRLTRCPDPQRSTIFAASLTVWPTKHLFGHRSDHDDVCELPEREAGCLFILPVTGSPGPRLHTGMPAYRPHRAVAGAGPRRQNSS